MNPAGQSLAIDPANVAILELTRNRRFERGNLAHTVLPFVDRERLAGTYMEWLRFHLGIRQSGMEEAKREARTSRFVAAAMARKTASLDTHMADVATLTAQLLLSQGAREEAADLYFVAGATLWSWYGARSRDVQEGPRAPWHAALSGVLADRRLGS